jgi:DNA-binding CsgD family transcriptional regulator
VFETRTSAPLVGRQQELIALLERLRAARRGDAGVVLVSGEPGIGKSRLLSELAACARAEGWQVLAGRAYETEGTPPYLPFVEALRAYVRTCPVEVLRDQLGQGASELATLLPELRRRLPDETAGDGSRTQSSVLSPQSSSERYRLFESVCDFLLAVSSRLPNPPAPFPGKEGGDDDGQRRDEGDGDGPRRREGGAGRGPAPDSVRLKGAGPTPAGLLLLLDDLHWADRPSLLLLLHLARRLGRAPLLVVGAYRSVGLGREHPLQELLADLGREELFATLALQPLSIEKTAELILTVSGASPAPAVLEALYHETEGNPFFLTEMLKHLRAEARDLADPGAAPAEWDIPEGLRRVIERRLARLSEAANRMLRAAAVLGDGFAFDLVWATSGLEFDPIADALDEALLAGILREAGGAYHFGHALIRRTLYEGVSPPRRERLHRRALEAIEQLHTENLDPHLAALAAHSRLAGASADRRTTLEYLRRAADAAAAVFAWEDAAAQRQAALDLLGSADDELRCELLLALGEAQSRMGVLPQVSETFGQAAIVAQKLGSPERIARAALGFPLTQRIGGALLTTQIALLEQALAVLDGADSSVRARVLANLALALAYQEQPDAGDAVGLQAVAMARRLGEPAGLAWVLHARRVALSRPGRVEERLSLATEMLGLAEAMGDDELALFAHRTRLTAFVELGDLRGADREDDAYTRLAEKLRQPLHRWLLLLRQTMRALLAGQFETARSLVDTAEDLGRRLGAPDDWYWWQRGMILWQTGTPAARGVSLENLPAAGFGILARRCGLIWLWCLLGREEARQEFERLAGDRFAAIRNDSLGLPALVLLALTCAALADARRAAILYDLLLPHAALNISQSGQVVCYGSAARYLGLLAGTLGRWDVAEAHFEAALTMNRELGARPWVALTSHDYAAMLLRRGVGHDRRRARALLDEALALYDELGMHPWAAKARELLADRRLTGIAAAQTYPNGLTEREVEVLRLIAAGRASREIAAELLLSIRTVGRHITNIYGKIGAGSKAEAATFASNHGITHPRDE